MFLKFLIFWIKCCVLDRIDENGPQLFHMDPSGTYLQFDAKAIGSGSEGAQQSLQEQYHKSITLKEATKTAFTILKQVSVTLQTYYGHIMRNRHCGIFSLLMLKCCNLQVMEEKLNETNVEAARVTREGGFQLIKGAELESIIRELEA